MNGHQPTKGAFNWMTSLQLGLIGGVAGVFVSLVGMADEFSKRDIIANLISMGQLILFLGLVGAAFLAARRSGRASWLGRVIAAGLTGLVSGAMLAALALFVHQVKPRSILPNASPALVEILTFEKGVTFSGFAFLLAASTLVGALAGLLSTAPALPRRALTRALMWVGMVGLLQDLIQITLNNAPLVGSSLDWMFGSGSETGLSKTGALAVFAVVGLGNILVSVKGAEVGARLRSRVPPGRRQAVKWATWALVAGILLYLPHLLGSYLSEVATTAGIYILAGLGLNIVVGFAGLLDLGYVAFFAIGAYVMGVLTATDTEIATSFQWNFWAALPVAVGASLLAGVLLGIPVLRMRGDYLAIVTLGFGEIIRILALSDFLKPYIGGSQGIVGVGRGRVGGLVFDRSQTLYYLVFAGCLLALFVSWRLRDSRMGRTWKAMREDEDVAQAMGINLVATKLLAFGTGAAFSGLAGAIFASKLGTIYPHSFALLFSINVLALIIVGGMGSLQGVWVGGLLLVGLPELLREFSEYRLLVYGAVLIAMMRLRPEGFRPEATHQRELRPDIDGTETAQVGVMQPIPGS